MHTTLIVGSYGTFSAISSDTLLGSGLLVSTKRESRIGQYVMSVVSIHRALVVESMVLGSVRSQSRADAVEIDEHRFGRRQTAESRCCHYRCCHYVGVSMTRPSRIGV